jgi:PAS domain S-box-containing protein
MAQRPSLSSPNISLRRRTLLFSAVSILLAIGLIGGLAYLIVLQSFIHLEDQQSLEHMQRARSALDEQIGGVRMFSEDWAHWDATNHFVWDKNPDYIESNLANDAFSTLGMDVAIVINADGKIIFEKAYDAERDAEVPVPEGLHDHLSPGSLLVDHADKDSEHTGILMLPAGPMIVSSFPILDSHERGPITGTFLWGRYLDEAAIQSLSDTVVLPLDFYGLDSDDLPADLRSGYDAARASVDGSGIQKYGVDSLSTYSVIDDIYGEPALLLRIEMRRSVYQAGLTTFFSMLGAVTAVALMIGGFTTLQLERSVLARMEQLRRALHQIVNPSARVSLSGRDELADLAGSINRMLGALEQSDRALRESEDRYRRLVELSPEAVAVLSEGLIVFVNAAGTRLVGAASPDELLGKPVLELLHPDYRALVIERMRDNPTQAEESRLIADKFIRLDGQVIDIETTSIPITYHSKPATQVVVRDITERKRAEVALQVAHEQLQATLDALPDLMFVLDADGRILDYRAPDASLLLIPPSEFLGKTILEFLPPEPAGVVMHAIERALVSGRVAGIVYQVVMPQGSRWFELSVAQHRESSVSQKRLVALARDVTERVIAQRALQESEQQFRSIFEGSSIGMALADKAGRLRATNPAYQQLLARSGEELRGMHFKDFTHSDDLNDSMGLWEGLLRGERDSYDMEKRYLRADGAVRWVQMRVTRFHGSTNSEDFVLAMAEDISERRRAVDAEREQRALVEALRDTAAALSSTLDVEEVFERILANASHVVPHDSANIMMIEDQTARVVRRHGYENIDLEAVKALRLRISDTRSLREMAETKRPLAIPDVKTFDGWVDVTVSRWIRSFAGAPICIDDEVVGFINLDSTTPNFYGPVQAEHLQAFAHQAALALRNARLHQETVQHLKVLAERNSELDAFSYTVAHDLKSPLQVLLGYADLLRTDYRKDMSEEVAKHLGTIEAFAHKMSDMVENLLMLSHLRSAEQAISVVDMKSVIEAAVTRLQNKIAVRGVQLVLPEEYFPVMGYAPWLEEIFANLLENAVKYIGADNPKPCIKLAVVQQQDTVRYEVRDNGIGIKQEHQATLWEMFTRFHMGAAAGSGLGLSIVRRIIIKLGGEVGAESAPGKGSTFWFTLPKAIDVPIPEPTASD